MIVVLSRKTTLTKEIIEIIATTFAGQLIAAMAPKCAASEVFVKLNVYDITESTDLKRIASANGVSAVILADGTFKSHWSIISDILCHSMPRFFQLSKGEIISYNLENDFGVRRDKSALFIYPGAILPAINGSRQRAMDLIFHMILLGYKIKILDNLLCAEDRYDSFLKSFGIERYTAPVRPSKTYAYIAKVFKYKIDRDFISRNLSVCSKLFKKKVLRLGSDCEFVVFSHTWTVPLNINRALPHLRVIVDTHDISFVREGGLAKWNSIVGKVYFSINKRSEIKRLLSADNLVCISNTDHGEMQKLLPDKMIVVIPPSFGWIEFSKPRPSASLRFGFIGANMAANILALRAIIDILWPAVLRVEPSARLYIAGDVCKSLNEHDYEIEGLIPLNRISSLSEFYDNIDVTFCPVVMRGGLNIKIAESIKAGRPVVASVETLGSFGHSDLLFYYDNEGELALKMPETVRLLRQLIGNPDKVEASSRGFGEKVKDQFNRGAEHLFGRRPGNGNGING